MKNLILLVIAFAVSGCSASIPAELLDKARIICENNGGLNFINVTSINDRGKEFNYAHCNNGAIFSRSIVEKVE